MRFRVIYADPPWNFRNYSEKGNGRNANQHYSCMTIEELKLLPVASIADEDCVLLMWATGPLLPVQLEVMAAWGFEYKTIGFSWMKGCQNGAVFMGGGCWTRSNAELCLLGTRGKPSRRSAAVRQAIYSVPGRHSEKPDLHDRIEALVDGPYIELFARREARPGWTYLGNEVTGNTIEADLLSLADQPWLDFR